ncbi:hypothetical protein [Deinococcus radiophilus]|uniref:Uncharacterized protein n=1 Tax=Deinococcus radiophilus TaxID=32062 RepID=A0A431VQ19_9DEIO|nr:hypothetical protein [Deinococcus radiophilus]RTR25302.1 hypothetical protein EJ104_11395 [Deinococcus radiophilus]UFA52048.1 hypothetical protein LMT64_14075 [Deinococcus radiophilus]
MATLITLRAALLLVLLALWLGYGLGRAFKDDATGRQEAYQQGGEDMLRLLASKGISTPDGRFYTADYVAQLEANQIPETRRAIREPALVRPAERKYGRRA